MATAKPVDYSRWCEVDPITGKVDLTRCNPLKRYRTFSYHHVLIVTNTATLQTDLQSEVGVDFYNHPDLKDTGKRFTPQYSKTGIPYIVLINGMTDTQYSIDSYILHNLIIPNEGVQDTMNIPGTAVHTDGSFIVEEPYSANFLETLSNAGEQLGTQVMMLTYFVKTFFVGTTAEGTIEQFGNVAPFPITISNISANFSYSGATYNVDFIPNTNGLANHPYLATVGGITVKTTPTIGDAAKAMTDKINKNLKDTVDKINKQNPDGTPRKADVYAIEIDDTYAKMSLDNLNVANKDGNGIMLASEQESSIPTMLENLLKLSKDVVKQMKPDTSGKVSMPQITSLVDVRDDRRYITYKVKPKTYYTVPPKSKKDCPNVDNEQYDKVRAAHITQLTDTLIKNNALFQYDYIFSGKNTDITSFEMKMDWAFGAFSTDTIEAKPTSQDKQATKPDPDTNIVAQTPPGNGTCTPPSVPSTPSSSSNAADPSSYELFRKTLNRYTQFQVFDARLEILGNPIFLGGVIAPDSDTTNSSNLIDLPAIVKINVYMPYVDPTTGQPDPISLKTADQTFKSPFWFDGLFQIYDIAHKFEKGLFTQEMSLGQLPTSDSLAVDSTTENDKSGTTTGDGGKRSTGETAASNTVKKGSPGKCRTATTLIVATGTDGGTNSDNVKAFLKMIRVAEGTATANGYRKYFGNGLFDSFASHPGVAHTGNGIKSTAAGAYQFLLGTWNELQAKYPALTSFDPVLQDKAAVYLIQRRNALDDVLNGRLESAINKCSWEWASFPPGRYGGQGYMCLESMKEVYEANGGKYAPA